MGGCSLLWTEAHGREVGRNSHRAQSGPGIHLITAPGPTQLGNLAPSADH